MKREVVILFVAIILLGAMQPCIADENHGLYWGFEVGDQFHFRDSGTPFVPVVNYYVEIDSIPDEVDMIVGTEFGDTEFYTFYNEDGTEMEDTPFLPFLMIPVGNWSYFQETMNETFFDEFEWVNTETEWGFIFSLSLTEAGGRATIKLSKIDGVLNLYRAVVEMDNGLTMTIQTERIDPQANQLLSTQIVIGIGVGIVALVIVGAAAKFRRN